MLSIITRMAITLMNSSLPRELLTPRLRLRRWRDDDLDAFASLNADARVREFFPSVATRDESAEALARMRRHFDEHGFGLWAVEIIGVDSCAGLIGLAHPRFNAHFTPCVEIGWRLAAAHWGQGYATEGARAAMDFGFDALGLNEIVAMTVPANWRSRRVMEKLGMRCSPADDFDHPLIPAGHPLQRHVLYRQRLAER